MTGPRCAWCKRFVPKGLEPKSWRVKVAKECSQNPRSRWNYWTRLVCDSCLPPDRGDLSFWIRVPTAEVERRRAAGWPEKVRR